MKKAQAAVAAATFLTTATAAWATPSTVFWTPATTYTQPYLVPHVTYDTYVAERGMLQNDYGLTIGILPFEKLQAEIGFDVFLPAGRSVGDAVYLNAKVTLPEGAFASWQPGLSVGIQSVGFKSDVSDFNHLHATVGKTLPVGVLAVGGYYGLNKNLYLSSTGEEQRAGFMASWVSPDIVIGLPGLQKILLLADVSTGKNAFGAAGGGLGLVFTPAIGILTGPVFFLDKDLYKAAYGVDWMWSVQLDVDVDLLAKK